MIPMKKLTVYMIACLAIFAGGVNAAPYKVGDEVKPFAAKDQHEKEYKFDSATRFLLVSFDMETGKKANKVLHSKGAAYLTQKKASYVANIYGMPGIGRMFAFRKMKKYAHRIIYADEKDLMTPYPEQKDKVTVLKLNSKGEILAISYWNPVNEEVDTYLK